MSKQVGEEYETMCAVRSVAWSHRGFLWQVLAVQLPERIAERTGGGEAYWHVTITTQDATAAHTFADSGPLAGDYIIEKLGGCVAWREDHPAIIDAVQQVLHRWKFEE